MGNDQVGGYVWDYRRENEVRERWEGHLRESLKGVRCKGMVMSQRLYSP